MLLLVLSYSSTLSVFQDSTAVEMRSSLFWNVTQSILVVIYRRFGKTNRSQLQNLFRPIGRPEMSVYNYQSEVRNITEEQRYYSVVYSEFRFAILHRR
jgi:hypothetical protein